MKTTTFYILILACLITSRFWPPIVWWITPIFTFSPSWVFILPSIVLMPLLMATYRWKLLVFMIIIVLIFYYIFSGWKLHSRNLGDIQSDETFSIRMISANVGHGGKISRLERLAKRLNLNVIALQEANVGEVASLFSKLGWNHVCSSHICLASSYDIQIEGSKTRRAYGDWGTMVMRTTIKFPEHETEVLVVHLESPREGLEEVLLNPMGSIAYLQDNTEQRRLESSIASSWASEAKNVIVAGDFNMTINSPIYQYYWSWLKNSFEQVGHGFGYTKYTSWHGVRIDHVLHDGYWQTRRAWVEQSLGGDHLPIYAELYPIRWLE